MRNTYEVEDRRTGLRFQVEGEKEPFMDQFDDLIQQEMVDEVERLRKDNQVIAEDYGKKVEAVLSVLRSLADKLDAIHTRLNVPPPKPPQVTVEAPNVIVNPTAVTVTPTPINIAPPNVTVNEAERPTKWRFELQRNSNGQTSEIIATAVE